MAEKALHANNESVKPTDIVGVGATAAVATNRDRRGADHMFVAIKTSKRIQVAHFVLEKGYGDRAWQGQLCDLLIVNSILAHAGCQQIPLPDCRVKSSELTAGAAGFEVSLRDLTPPSFADTTRPTFIDADGVATPMDPNAPIPGYVILSGAFNPLHAGHCSMAALAEAGGMPVAFEISVQNAEKGGVDLGEVGLRTLQFRGRWPVFVSFDLPRFVDKARRIGKDFIVGADTAKRICETRFYGGSAEGLKAAMDELRALGCKFHVFSRARSDGTLESVADVVPAEFRDLFVQLPGRWDISSTKIRGH
jgi:hypothetical protein